MAVIQNMHRSGSLWPYIWAWLTEYIDGRTWLL